VPPTGLEIVLVSFDYLKKRAKMKRNQNTTFDYGRKNQKFRNNQNPKARKSKRGRNNQKTIKINQKCDIAYQREWAIIEKIISAH